MVLTYEESVDLIVSMAFRNREAILDATHIALVYVSSSDVFDSFFECDPFMILFDNANDYVEITLGLQWVVEAVGGRGFGWISVNNVPSGQEIYFLLRISGDALIFVRKALLSSGELVTFKAEVK